MCWRERDLKEGSSQPLELFRETREMWTGRATRNSEGARKFTRGATQLSLDCWRRALGKTARTALRSEGRSWSSEANSCYPESLHTLKNPITPREWLSWATSEARMPQPASRRPNEQRRYLRVPSEFSGP
jgi:hypothetical protein